jgi:porin
MSAKFHPVSPALTIALALAAAPLSAAEPAPAFETGIDVTLEAGAGVRGGAQRGQSLQALTLAHAAWRNHPAESAAQLRAFASVLNHEGRGPTGRYLGDFLAASNIEAYDSTRLYSWWFEVEQAGWSLRAGALIADEELTGTTAGGYLANSVFGWPAFISANTVNTGPAFFVAAPGIRLAHTLTPALTVRGGVYDGDTFDSAAGDARVNRHGLHYDLGGPQGFFTIGEVAYAPADGASSFTAGAWAHTAKFADVRDDATGRRFAATGAGPRQHDGNYGAYATVQRTLAGKSGEAGHVTAFVRTGLAPQDRNTLGAAIDTGIAATGLIPGRAKDITAAGFAHASFSSHYAANARASAPGDPAPDYEQVFELNHTVALGEHFSVQPDVQFIRHPGGSAAQRDALLFVLRIRASY